MTSLRASTPADGHSADTHSTASAPVSIRLMRADDFPRLLALWQSCTGMGLNDVDDTPQSIARFLERNPTTCFVAQSDTDGGILGAILSGHDGRRGYIYHTAVSPSARHQGIASRLVSCVCEAMKRENIAKVELAVFSRNVAGNAFWQAQGFTARHDLVYRNLALRQITRYDS